MSKVVQNAKQLQIIIVTAIVIQLVSAGTGRTTEAVAPASPSEAGLTDEERTELFELWNECFAFNFKVYLQKTKAKKIRLEKGDIETLVHSRLRAARLYDNTAWQETMDVDVSMLEPTKHRPTTFTTTVTFSKYVQDINTGIVAFAPLWQRNYVGVLSSDLSASDADFILAGLSRSIDRFIDAFLKVNEEACHAKSRGIERPGWRGWHPEIPLGR